jgi:hypothetical protein
MTASVSAPESRRIEVKLAASIELPSSASRHSTEFAANAIRARSVATSVLSFGWWALLAIEPADLHVYGANQTTTPQRQ